MANRYWVGGTGNWDATTTNWSAISGGAGGASVPTSVDDVFFDTLSNATAYVCTLTTAPTCRSVTVAGPASGNVTIAGSAVWGVYGSFTIAATGVTYTHSGTLTLNSVSAGNIITTNGVVITSPLNINFNGGTWALGSAYTSTPGVTINGTFTTNNFNFTVNGGNFNSNSSNTRTLNLGSSTITCVGWNLSGSTNLTVNSGTSTISLTGGTFNGNGQTYYNVTRVNNGFAIGDANNTFNALTNTTVTGNQTYACSFVGNQTIGTFTVNGGSAPTQRVSIQSATAGVQIILTVASFATNGYVDFRDINLQGAASPLTVATGGDAGNNLNITLQTPKTVYWNLVGGGNWNIQTAWALTSGGVPAAANYPLPQDTAIIQDTGLNSGATITISSNAIGTIDVSTRTLPMTLTAAGGFPTVYGNLTLSSAVTTGTGTFTFSGYNKTQTFTSAGVSVAFGVTVNGTSTTFALGGALTMTGQFVLTLGTLNLANNNLTCGLFNSNNSNTRVITFGTGSIYVTGNAASVWLINGTNLTYTGTPNVYLTYSGSTGTRTISGSGGTNAFDFYITAGTDVISLGTSTSYGTIDFTGFNGTLAALAGGATAIRKNLIFSSGMTFTNSPTGYFSFTGATGGDLKTNGMTIKSDLVFNGTGITTLQSALTSTYGVTFNSGTFNLNGYVATFATTFATNATSNARNIAFNDGSIVLTGSGIVWIASSTGFTTTGSGTISMTSASSKTFAGGGFSYPTLNQGGAGTLIITGANTFANMTNTVQPCTITFPASTTTTVSNFNVNGTAGNLVTLNSSTPGTRFTLAKI